MTETPRGQRSPRVKVQLPVRIRTALDTIEGKTVDLSATGAFICCREALERKEKIQIFFADPSQPEGDLWVFAEVVRPDILCIDDVEMSYGIAVEFIMIPIEARQFIATLMPDSLQAV